MTELIIYIVFITCSCLNRIPAYTFKHAMDRIDYLQDRLYAESVRLNAESKVRKDEFNVVFNKLENIETMLHNVLEKKEARSDTSRINDQITAVSDEKLKIYRNAFQEEKVQNTRFRRDLYKTMDRETKQTKKAYERIENSLDYISTKIEMLKKEAMTHHTNSEKNAENLQQIVEEENVKHLKPFVNLTKETVETIALNVIYVKEHVHNIKVNLQTVMQRQNQNMCLDGTHDLTTRAEKGEETTVEPCKMCIDATYDLTTKAGKQEVTTVKPNKMYKSCLDLYNNGYKSNGIFKIEIHKSESDTSAIPVYCDMTTDNGGWTVFQRRQDGSVDFFRDWNDYKVGFGDMHGEFWLGNEYIYSLTNDGETHELRIDLEDHEGNRAYAKYSNFKVGSESKNYILDVSDYTGDAGDSLMQASSSSYINNGMQFTTKDRDNDRGGINCASTFNGAWWFRACFSSHLNGLYQDKSKCDSDKRCIVWTAWKGWRHNMKFTEMKLR